MYSKQVLCVLFCNACCVGLIPQFRLAGVLIARVGKPVFVVEKFLALL
jgi:hypothetical protein